jgi:hypothetical protein
MDPDLQDKLVADYPALFADLPFGVECGDGWYQLIRQFCESASKRGDPIRLSQIKEKWGGLRVYYYGGDEFVAGACEVVERLSYFVCEGCGKPGVCARTGGWYRTECGECRRGVDSTP